MRRCKQQRRMKPNRPQPTNDCGLAFPCASLSSTPVVSARKLRQRSEDICQHTTTRSQHKPTIAARFSPLPNTRNRTAVDPNTLKHTSPRRCPTRRVAATNPQVDSPHLTVLMNRQTDKSNRLAESTNTSKRRRSHHGVYRKRKNRNKMDKH